MNRAEKSAGAAHRGLRMVSGGDGAEKAQGHSRASTESASDLHCPPDCNHQGRDCPARGEFSDYGRGPAAWHLVWIAAGVCIWGAIAWLIV